MNVDHIQDFGGVRAARPAADETDAVAGQYECVRGETPSARPRM
jgi:hypothetical protein